MCRTITVLQPYQVGKKKNPSLALVIPAKVVKECRVTTNTIFLVRTDKEAKTVTLQTVNLDENIKKNSAGDGTAAQRQ
jgi:hypothetical protein